jgi:exodeoxyribonuclease VII large subunit
LSREVVPDGAGGFHVRFPFDRRLVDLIKSLPRRRWQAADKTWWVPGEDVVALVDLLQPEGFEFDDEVGRLYGERGGTRTLAAAGPRRPAAAARAAERSLFDEPPPEEAGDNYTVGRLNREVRVVLEGAFPAPIWLVGEISGFNRNKHKRHVGFALVERDAAGETAFQVGAIVFEDTRREIERKLRLAGDPFLLEDEIQVRVGVRVDLYDAWGAYRVVVQDLDVKYTLGEAARRRDEIVRALGAQGLLEKNTSLSFPPLPLRVGLITSLGSDAYHDVLRTLKESGFAFSVTAHGARVQGRSTESTVLNALDWFRPRVAHFDVVMICRGGGSRSDLSWFDTEPLGRAVALFPIPVVVGIGHEQDLSVLDHVGWRAKTPTAAAALLVERVRSALLRIDELSASVLAGARELLEVESRRRRDTARRLARAARSFLDMSRIALLAGARQLGQAARRDLAAERRRAREAARALGPRAARAAAREGERLEARARRLHLVDPLRVVERGYAILRRADGRVVADPAAAPKGARLTADLRAGRLALVSDGPAARMPARGEE